MSFFDVAVKEYIESFRTFEKESSKTSEISAFIDYVTHEVKIYLTHEVKNLVDEIRFETKE